VKKNYDNSLSRFHTIPERNGLTDRQTVGRTDFPILISRVSMLTRDKTDSPITHKLNVRKQLCWLENSLIAINCWRARLKIADLGLDDSGTYRCEGYNQFGRQWTNGTLLVRHGTGAYASCFQLS